VAFSPEGSALLVGGAGLFLVDRATGRVQRSLVERSETVACACFSPDGSEILAGLHDKKALQLLDRATGEVLQSFVGNERPLLSCAFSPDGRCLASTAMENAARLWDRSSGRLLRLLEAEGGVQAIRAQTCCSFSPDGGTLIAIDNWGAITLWDLGRPFPLEVCFPGFARDPVGSVRRAFDAIDFHARPWEPTAEELPGLVPPGG
jgi:WD40 repeat protein